MPVQVLQRKLPAMAKPFLGKILSNSSKQGDNDWSQCYAKLNALIVDGRITDIDTKSGIVWKWGAYPGHVRAQAGADITGAIPFVAGSRILNDQSSYAGSPRSSIHSIASTRKSSSSSTFPVADSRTDRRRQSIIFSVRSCGRIQDVRQAYYDPCARGPFESYSPTDPLYCQPLPDLGLYTCSTKFSVDAKTAKGAALAYERDISTQIRLGAIKHLVSGLPRLTAEVDNYSLHQGQIAAWSKPSTWSWGTSQRKDRSPSRSSISAKT